MVNFQVGDRVMVECGVVEELAGGFIRVAVNGAIVSVERARVRASPPVEVARVGLTVVGIAANGGGVHALRSDGRVFTSDGRAWRLMPPVPQTTADEVG